MLKIKLKCRAAFATVKNTQRAGQGEQAVVKALPSASPRALAPFGGRYHPRTHPPAAHRCERGRAHGPEEAQGGREPSSQQLMSALAQGRVQQTSKRVFMFLRGMMLSRYCGCLRLRSLLGPVESEYVSKTRQSWMQRGKIQGRSGKSPAQVCCVSWSSSSPDDEGPVCVLETINPSGTAGNSLHGAVSTS